MSEGANALALETRSAVDRIESFMIVVCVDFLVVWFWLNDVKVIKVSITLVLCQGS